MNAQAPSLDRLQRIPRDEDGPAFREPWEAEAFGIAVHLVERGHFTWAEWAAALASQIRMAQATGDPDLGDTYYLHWLETLIAMCAKKGIVGLDGLGMRTEEWRAAYRRTPHGEPVLLDPTR